MRIGTIGLLAAALLGAGCFSNGPVSSTGRPFVTLTERIYFFIDPKELRDETAYPEGVTRQLLHWEREEFRWRLTFPTNGYAYAGLELRRPLDLQPCMSHGNMLFTVRPACAATNLTFALVDGDRCPHKVMVHQLVQAKPLAVNSNIALVNLPLVNFPTQGVVLDADSPEESTAPFDSADVREVRLVTAGGLEGRPVTISYLRVEH